MDDILDQIMQAVEQGDAVAIAYLAVTVLIVVVGIIALVMECIVAFRYMKANKMPISNNMSGADAARYVLDKNGLNDVTVKASGFIREFVFGNFYNIYTKTIYLRSVLFKIDNKKSVTATAIAVQKAGLASLCEDGDKATITRNRLAVIGVFGPILFIPLLILGVILDYFVLHAEGKIAIIFLLASGAFTVMGFIVTMLNVPVEKKANARAIEMIRASQLANEEEIAVIQKVYDAYIMSYICDFILEILRLLQWVLEIVFKLKSNKD